MGNFEGWGRERSPLLPRTWLGIVVMSMGRENLWCLINHSCDTHIPSLHLLLVCYCDQKIAVVLPTLFNNIPFPLLGLAKNSLSVSNRRLWTLPIGYQLEALPSVYSLYLLLFRPALSPYTKVVFNYYSWQPLTELYPLRICLILWKKPYTLVVITVTCDINVFLS